MVQQVVCKAQCRNRLAFMTQVIECPYCDFLLGILIVVVISVVFLIENVRVFPVVFRRQDTEWQIEYPVIETQR